MNRIILVLVLILGVGSIDGQKPKKTFVVDSVWMAQYRLMEALWAYPIPEDDEITYEDGKYIVPVVVYRHYEDMVIAEKSRTK